MSRLLFLLPIAGLFAVAALGYWALNAPRNLQAPPSQLIERQAPAITAPILKANGLSEPQANQVQVVNFFASYCIPCIHEHSQLVEISADPQVHLSGVTFNDPPDATLGFLARLGDPFDVVVNDAQSADAIAWGVSAIPTTFVVTPSGKVIYRHDGAINLPELNDVLSIIEGAKAQ